VLRGFPRAKGEALMDDVYKVIANSTGNRLVLFAAVIDKAAFALKTLRQGRSI